MPLPFFDALRKQGWGPFRGREPDRLPVKLGQRGVWLRIFFTPFGQFLVLMMFATTMASLNSSNNYALMFSLMASSILALSLFLTNAQLVKMRVLAIHAFPAHAGQPVVVRLTLDHPGSRKREGISLTLAGVTVVTAVPAGEPFSVDLRLPPMERGLHAMGPLLVQCRRPFGLAKAWARFTPAASYLIYPTLELHPPLPPGHGNENPANRSGRTGTEVHHLRMYRQGDPLRDIAWKATARSGRLMAREYEANGGGQRLFQWADVAHLPLELQLSRLAAWVVQADAMGLATELHLPHLTLGPSQGVHHRHACLAALAQVTSE